MLSGALSAHGLLLAAGTLSDGILVILAEPVGDVLYAGGHILALDGFFNWDDVHAYARASRRDHGSHILQRHLGHQVEESCQLRVLRRQLVVHHHELRRAGHEDRHIILFVVIRVLTVHFDQAHPDQVVHHLLGFLVRHPVYLGQILDVVRNASLLKAQKEFGLLLREHFIECPVLGIIRIHRPRILDQIAVCDHGPEFQYQFFLFRVSCNVIRVLSEVPLVHHTVFLVFHFCCILQVFVFAVSAHCND